MCWSIMSQIHGVVESIFYIKLLINNNKNMKYKGRDFVLL